MAKLNSAEKVIAKKLEKLELFLVSCVFLLIVVSGVHHVLQIERSKFVFFLHGAVFSFVSKKISKYFRVFHKDAPWTVVILQMVRHNVKFRFFVVKSLLLLTFSLLIVDISSLALSYM